MRAEPASGGLMTRVAAPPTGGLAQRAMPGQNRIFTKVTAGDIVNDRGKSLGCAWGDYDNDGFIDLIVANFGQNFLYRNDGRGTFTRVTAGPFVELTENGYGCVWGDYDNDGQLDLFVAMHWSRGSLYRNLGGGTFAEWSGGNLVDNGGFSHSCAWGDYDNDGYLDLFIANFTSSFLYHNTGGGHFTKVTHVRPVLDRNQPIASAWGDYNNDGALDLFVSSHVGKNTLYRSDRDGTFSDVTQAAGLPGFGSDSHGCSWGDFDNNGFLDLFVASNGRSSLYRNNGNGTFTPVSSGPIATNLANSVAAVWGDYDNDGYLDLFVANRGYSFLYHNEAGLAFSQIPTGDPVSDFNSSWGAAWGDYDNDGFPDLFVSNGGDALDENNSLYRNNGNQNAWINIRCIGTVSNRSAIGTKVRVSDRSMPTIGNSGRWQMREISGGCNSGGQDDLRVSFGLGSATKIETLRIEWPSGLTQEFHNLLPRQFLTVIEPPRLQPPRVDARQVQLELIGGIGRAYVVQGSSDLVNWRPAATLTNWARSAFWTPILAPGTNRQFYRAVER